MIQDRAKIAETRKALESAGVKYCFAAYVDIHGVPKAKTVPIDKFEKMCAGSELFTVGAMDGLGLVGPEKDECAAVPDLNSMIILPWNPECAWFAADLYFHGEPYENCPRVILRKTLAKTAERKLVFNLGVEPEFYIYRQSAEALSQFAVDRFKGITPAYDVDQTMQSMAILDRIASYMKQLGWGLYSFDAEGGHGQYEFDFDYADALTMADRMIFLRFMIKQVAREFDCRASFMPKPTASDFRSGAHFNMSLADITTGKNLFDKEQSPLGEMSGKYGISFPDIGYHFVAGMLAHAPALAAVTCPTYNSYKGLVAQGDMPDMSWAPVLRCYGNNNRSAMLRLPMSRPCIENRAPDMSTNFYLAAALSLAAGMEGVDMALDPGAPLNDNLYLRKSARPTASGRMATEAGHVERLPRTLLEALDAFETDPLVVETFGAAYRDIYLEYKMKEWDRFFYPVYAEEREKALNFI